MMKKVLPIGKQMRLKESSKKSVDNNSNSNCNVDLFSIEERIALLEKDLDDDESSSDESDDESNEIIQEDVKIKVDKDGKVLKIVSSLDNERIEPLPKEYLPRPMCSKTSTTSSNAAPLKRSIRFSDEPSTQQSTSIKKSRGLESTVREMMQSYQPTSQDKKPFWCRVCRYQAENISDFDHHRNSDSHLQLVALERKASFCKLCRKQFTSPEQLKEHLVGKQHIEKIERIKQSQQNRSNSTVQYC